MNQGVTDTQLSNRPWLIHIHPPIWPIDSISVWSNQITTTLIAFQAKLIARGCDTIGSNQSETNARNGP